MKIRLIVFSTFGFQTMFFFYVWFFCPYCPKISSNVHFNAFNLENSIVLLKIGKQHLVFCYKINTLTNLIYLRKKLSSEICQKVRSLDGKMRQNWIKTCTFSLLTRKTTALKEKRETLFSIIKIEIPINFIRFIVKNDFGNMTESAEFRFENSLNQTH